MKATRSSINTQKQILFWVLTVRGVSNKGAQSILQNYPYTLVSTGGKDAVRETV